MTIAQINAQGGFVTDRMIADVVAECPHQRMLIRCDEFRLLCPAQDTVAIIACLERGGANLRDVSINNPDNHSR